MRHLGCALASAAWRRGETAGERARLGRRRRSLLSRHTLDDRDERRFVVAERARGPELLHCTQNAPSEHRARVHIASPVKSALSS